MADSSTANPPSSGPYTGDVVGWLGVILTTVSVAIMSCADPPPGLIDEAILEPPPSAILLSSYAQQGTPGPVAVRSHESRLFASPDSVGEVLRFYLEDAAVGYDFPAVDRGEALRRGWVQILGSARDVDFEVFISDEPLELTGGGGSLEILTDAPPGARTWIRVGVSR